MLRYSSLQIVFTLFTTRQKSTLIGDWYPFKEHCCDFLKRRNQPVWHRDRAWVAATARYKVQFLVIAPLINIIHRENIFELFDLEAVFYGTRIHVLNSVKSVLLLAPLEHPPLRTTFSDSGQKSVEGSPRRKRGFHPGISGRKRLLLSPFAQLRSQCVSRVGW